MKSTLHELKILSCYFGPVAQGVKTFEVRYNDRDYHVGDILKLCEWSTTGGYTGKWVNCEITFITNYAQQDNYIVMAIKLLN